MTSPALSEICRRTLPLIVALPLLAALPPAWAVEDKPETPPTTTSAASTPLVPMDKEDTYQELVAKAMQEFDQKRYDEAIALLDKAQEIYPSDPFALNARGAILTKKKEWEEAAKFFNRALNQDPQFFPARFNLGEILFLQGKHEEALAYFDSLNQIFSRNELIQFKLVLLFLITDRMRDAERTVSRMQFPGNGPAWYYAHAAVEMSKGNRSEAKKYLKAARQLFDEKTLTLFEESLAEAKLAP